MNVTVLLFATLKDNAGTNKISLDLPGKQATLNDLRASLSATMGKDHPGLAEILPSAVAAINQEFAFPGDPIREGDVVAFFPPVSGGQSQWPESFEVARAPLDLNALMKRITSPATGAVCFFSGAVRGETNTEGEPVLTSHLEYEAYEPMAVAKMQHIAGEIRQRWPLVQGIAMVQRVGSLEVGEPTVVIACASAHRDQGCFEAARYGIDRLKEIVPVWKKEVSPNGSEWVEGHYVPTPNDRPA
ncbi:MAG TPA: molybdenum cofactor biosynthesis protein MoaE [Aggregatilineales bacterium]|nr:molybdenum cofactor biosynthesis protein MoaE [Aggregatilineales bacterium]